MLKSSSLFIWSFIDEEKRGQFYKPYFFSNAAVHTRVFIYGRPFQSGLIFEIDTEAGTPIKTYAPGLNSKY
jgi:hypothetical protein